MSYLMSVFVSGSSRGYYGQPLSLKRSTRKNSRYFPY